MVKPFIRIEKTLDDALSFDESVINVAFNYKCIQLLPNNENAYTQVSSHDEGIELEDWTVFAVTLCGEKTDITDYFMVFDNPTDGYGMPQVIWQLKNVPFDFGIELIYLEINQLLGETFYSSPFLLTDINSDKTARFDYKAKKDDFYQSIQLQTWFRQKLNRDEITNYYEVSTKNTVSVAIKETIIEKWETGLFNNELFISFRDMLNARYTYCNLRRFNIYEAFEIPMIEGNVNYSPQEYQLTFNYKDILNENINEMTILEEIALIKAQLEPVTAGKAIWVWNDTLLSIPAGWQEVTDLRGKTVIGQLEDDTDFGLLGQTGGNKKINLTASQNAPHTHFIANNENSSANVPLSATNYLQRARDVGGNPPEDYELTGSATASTIGKTSEQGTGSDINILNPYRIVHFIEWVGLP